MARDFGGGGFAICNPFGTSTVHDTGIFVTVVLKEPESVARPPVVFVAVKNHGVVVADAKARDESGEGFVVYKVADVVALQVGVPVHFDRAWNVGLLVQQEVFVDFDQFEVGIGVMLEYPIGADQNFGMNV